MGAAPQHPAADLTGSATDSHPGHCPAPTIATRFSTRDGYGDGYGYGDGDGDGYGYGYGYGYGDGYGW